MEALISPASRASSSGGPAAASTETTTGQSTAPPSPVSPPVALADLPEAVGAAFLSRMALPPTPPIPADTSKADLVGIVFRVSVGGTLDVVVDVGLQEQVAIVGNCGVLGNWNTQQPLRLQLWWKPSSPNGSSPDSPSNLCWVSPTVFMERHAFADLEFKCVVLRPLHRHLNIAWETFGPHVFENRRLPQESREGGGGGDDVRVVRMEFGRKATTVEKIKLPGHRCLPAFPSTASSPASHQWGSPSRTPIRSTPPFGGGIGMLSLPFADLLTNSGAVASSCPGDNLTGRGPTKMGGAEKNARRWGGSEQDDAGNKAAKVNEQEEVEENEHENVGIGDLERENMATTTSSGTAVSTPLARLWQGASEDFGAAVETEEGKKVEEETNGGGKELFCGRGEGGGRKGRFVGFSNREPRVEQEELTGVAAKLTGRSRTDQSAVGFDGMSEGAVAGEGREEQSAGQQQQQQHDREEEHVQEDYQESEELLREADVPESSCTLWTVSTEEQLVLHSKTVSDQQVPSSASPLVSYGCGAVVVGFVTIAVQWMLYR
eukprot:GHVS01024972.1.p1 GENE.GHVS01024972.1~~GHVS01024972.1.p1  ORF type:complete len:547 (-),score=109.26 GHVS01024972.1:515-2155(-)